MIQSNLVYRTSLRSAVFVSEFKFVRLMKKLTKKIYNAVIYFLKKNNFK